LPKNAQLILSAEISVFPSMFSNSLSSARKERLQTFFPVPGTCDMSWNTQGYAPPNEHGMNPNGLLPEGQGSGLAPQEGGSGSDAGEIPRIIFYTRMLNLILGIAMIVVSLLSLLTTDNMTTGVLACYVVAFACLLCCFESGLQVVLRVIALNFGFMYSAKARSVFMLFVGSILFSFSLFGKIVGFAMLANAGFNIYAIVKYPGFEEAQRDRSTSERTTPPSPRPLWTRGPATWQPIPRWWCVVRRPAGTTASSRRRGGLCSRHMLCLLRGSTTSTPPISSPVSSKS